MSCNSLRFVGIEDVTLIQGEGIDLESGVEAYDANGDAIPFTVKPETIEKCDVGTHVVQYSAAGYGGEGGKIHLCGENEAHIPPQCNRDVIVANRTITIEQADPPTIAGVEDVSLEVGDTFDVMEGVSATDALGNTIPVSWHGVGDYEVESEGQGESVSFETDLAPNDLKELSVTFEPTQGCIPWVHNDNEQVPYLFRATDGTVPEIGNRIIDKIIGGTVAWNQRATYIAAGADNGITYTWNNDGSYTLNGTATANSYRFVVSGVPTNHVSLVRAVSESDDVQMWFAGYAGVYGKEIIYKPGATYGVCLYVLNGVTLNNVKVYPQVIDLTAMFGSTIANYIYTLEQATAGAGVAWFRRLFPNDYYAYNAGELLSVEGLESHDMVGFNQWDEEWEVGALNGNTGLPSSGNTIRSKNFYKCLPNTMYYTSGDLFFYWYDESQVFISYNYGGGNVVTSPSNARYLKIGTRPAYGTTYKNDICINISNASRNGEYEPYVKHSYALDSDLVLRGIPKLDASNNLYYDGDTYASDGTVTRKYGIVDLGTLNWQSMTTSNRPYFLAPFSLHKSGSSKVIGTWKYKWSTYASEAGTFTTTQMSSTYGFYVYNDGEYADANAFKSAMSGVYLVYELATPTTETATAYTNPQVVDPDGTEEYVTTGIVPVGHETDHALACPILGSDGVEVYDDSLYAGLVEWNQQAPSEPVAKSASGAIVSIPDSSGADLISLVADINPIQDLNGYDKPWVGGAGKNLFDIDNTSQYAGPPGATPSSAYGEKVDNKLIVNYGLYSNRVYFDIPPIELSANESFTISFDCLLPSGITSNNIVWARLSDGTNVTSQDGASTVLGTKTHLSITLQASVAGEYNKLCIQPSGDANAYTNLNCQFTNIQIEKGSSATSYEPYSNICPISGWDEVSASVTGKNLFDKDNYNVLNGYIDSGVIISSGSSRSVVWMECKPNTAYAISRKAVATNERFGFGWTEDVPAVGTSVYGATSMAISTTVGTTITRTLTTGADAKYLAIWLGWTDRDAEAETFQLELGSTATAYEPYQGQTYTADLGQTVYGGTVDLVSGLLTVDRAMVDLGSLTWTQLSGYIQTTDLRNDIKIPASNNTPCDVIAEQYFASTWAGIANNGIAVAQSGALAISGVTSASGKMVYPLATPQTYQLTPQQIATILGNNNIWADSGDVDVEYYGTTLDMTLDATHVYYTNIGGVQMVAFGSVITVTVGEDMVVDLTEMFGETKAEEILDMELAESGSGVAYFRNLVPDDYYEYNEGETTNVSAISNLPYFHGTQDFGQTIYGGTYDFVNGALSVEWALIDLGTLDWHPASASRWFAGIIGIKTDDAVLGNPNHLLSDYYVATQNIVDSSTLANGQMTQNANTTVGSITIKDTAFDGATAEQVKQAMSGRHLAYRVDHPRVIQFEPQQIQSIEGENYVWSEDGKVKVIYTKTLTDEEITFPTNGYYEITYEAEDECGNKTTVIRQISVEVLRTVLYSDGTFIINETFEDMSRNRALYGNEAYTYPPLDAEHDYVFRLSTQAPWHHERGLVQKAKIGSPIQPTSTAHWYESMTWLFDADFTNIDTSKTTSMANMFAYCQNLYELDLSMFETSNVTSMFNMFGTCTNLVELNIATFDTSSVTDFRQMFAYCNRLADLNISGFDTSNATNMASMFLYCSGLTSIDLSGFNTAKVVNMTSMFSSCTNLTSLDLSAFNTQSVETMKHMFSYCSGLTTLDLSMFITESLTDINAMFDHCSNLETVDMSNFDTSNVRDMAYLFNECRKLTSARLESFDTSIVETMLGMFSNCGSLVELDISNFATPRVTTMANMFNGCALLELLAICRFETSNVTNMNKMFNRCTSLASIYASDYFVTYNVTDDTDMFLGDTSLVGELGTAYDPNYIGKEYARIDREDTLGYFYGCPDMSE